MTIWITNAPHMFQVFDAEQQFYMTITVGGVAQYDVTVTLSPEEFATFRKDENLAIALAADVATRMSAYEARMVKPSINPM